MLLCLRGRRCLIGLREVLDLGLVALLLLLPTAAVVDLIVEAELKLVVIRTDLAVLLTKATERVALSLKLFAKLRQLG